MISNDDCPVDYPCALQSSDFLTYFSLLSLPELNVLVLAFLNIFSGVIYCYENRVLKVDEGIMGVIKAWHFQVSDYPCETFSNVQLV